MTFWERWGKTLRGLRENQGLSRRDLEDASGVSQRQISYLEKGQKRPRADTLDALAKVLGPELVQAAFPRLIVLPSKRPTPDKLTPTVQPMLRRRTDLVAVGG
jgi:transcriptional regulator with XRE-family HTH domain